MTDEPRRPALRYHGGKWRLAPWILQHAPRHRVYVEPFGGGASVLLRKRRCHAEVYNDLDGDPVNLFRVLQAPELRAKLIQAVELTPFAREEFVLAYEPTLDPIERARRLIIRSFQGFGSNGHNISVRTGFRNHSHRSGTTPAVDWTSMPPALAAVAKRFIGVVIENRPAIEVMRQHDSRSTLHYVDPPYVHATRSSRLDSRRDYHGYAHEMTDEGHAVLLQAVLELDGMVLLSGYSHPLYEHFLAGWRQVQRDVQVVSNQTRTECLWINPAAAEALAAERGELFFEISA